jgi:hypothetical protein
MRRNLGAQQKCSGNECAKESAHGSPVLDCGFVPFFNKRNMTFLVCSSGRICAIRNMAKAAPHRSERFGFLGQFKNLNRPCATVCRKSLVMSGFFLKKNCDNTESPEFTHFFEAFCFYYKCLKNKNKTV